MDLPNEHILDVFFPQTPGEAAIPDYRNEPRNRIAAQQLNIMHQMAVTRELRMHNTMLGAGDGLHNNQIRFDETLPPFIIVRNNQASKFWHYMPLLLLMSNWLFKFTLNVIGIDTQSVGLLGISYNVHFNILQWLILFASYCYKGFSA